MSSQDWKALALFFPAIRKITSLVLLKLLTVNDTRSLGAFGALRTGITSLLLSQSWPGNKLAIWPSSPNPNKTKSN